MLIAWVLFPVLAAAPAPVKLASPGFNYVNIDENTGSLFVEYFARQLEAEGLSVITPQEIGAVLGLERQKQLLGCADENAASCMAELAGGLGVNGIITGTLGKVGTGFTVSVKVVDARNAASLGAYSTRAADEDAVFDWLSATARDLAGKQAPPKPQVALRDRAWIPAVGAGVLSLAGGASLFQASRLHTQLIDGDTRAIRDEAGLRAAVENGETFQAAGLGLLAAGVAALGLAGGLYLLGGEDEAPVQASAYLSPGGGGLALGGSF